VEGRVKQIELNLDKKENNGRTCEGFVLCTNHRGIYSFAKNGVIIASQKEAAQFLIEYIRGTIKKTRRATVRPR
jgi:hypothetical protein